MRSFPASMGRKGKEKKEDKKKEDKKKDKGKKGKKSGPGARDVPHGKDE